MLVYLDKLVLVVPHHASTLLCLKTLNLKTLKPKDLHCFWPVLR